MPLVALAWLVLALVLTLAPAPEMATVAGGVDPLCVVCGDRGLADLALNVAFFVPFGWAITRHRDWRRGVAAGLVVAMGIEGLQLFIPGRFTTLGDLLANGTGAALGAWLAGREARVLPGAAVGAVLASVAPAALLAPAAPEGVYYGQWTARFGNMAHYGGRVLEAFVGGVATPSRRSSRTDALRRTLEGGGPVEVRFVAGPATPSPAPVFSIFDDRRRRILLLAVDGWDVVVHRWTVATTWKLDSPELRWPEAMSGVMVGDTVWMRLARGHDAPCLNVNGRTECDTAIGAGAGWTLLLSPGGLSPGRHQSVAFLWMLILGGAVGLVPWPAWIRVLLAGTMAGSALTLPVLLPYLSTSPVPALGLACGAGAGMLIRWRSTAP